jgi:DNA-binding CsgD family transcriptional regulator
MDVVGPVVSRFYLELPMDKIELALAAMSPIQARRWRLRLAGKKLREIARIEGISKVTVYISLKRGKKRAEKRVGWLKKG